MMYALEPSDYDEARSLFQPMHHHLAVTAIVEGSVPTQIYVDHPTHPRAALTWNHCRFYLVGEPNNEQFNQAIRQLFTETIYPQALQAGEDLFVLYYEPGGWEPKIDVILKDKFPIRVERQFYTREALKNDWRARLPKGFSLKLVDRALLDDGRLKNLAYLTAEMCSERQSAEDFLEKSFGVCLVRDDEIVGWCLSEYNSADRCEVGIETRADYRRRGLATVMASTLVEQALSRGISQIGWHCYASNTASVATALKVGFEKQRDYPVYLAYLDEVENLAVNGDVCFRKKEYEQALAWYQRAFARGADQDWICWGAACAAALLGKPDAALGYLAQAIDAGFADLEYMQNSAHLKSLHATQAWSKLIARLEKKSAANS